MIRTSILRGQLVALGSAILAAGTLLCTPAFAGNPHNPPPTTNPCDTPGAGTTYGARAYSVFLDTNIAGIDVDLGPVPDTGELPATGGTGAATLATIDGVPLPIPLPPEVSLNALVLHNTTMGSGDTSTAHSSVMNLSLGLQAGLTNILGVGADVLTANSTRKCVGSPLSATTDASKTGANIAGLAISISGMPLDLSALPTSVPPNFSLLEELPAALPAALAPLVSGRIILNEQYPDANGRQVVNALHIDLEVLSLLGGLVTIDLVVSHAEAGITCGTGTNPNSCNCKVKDFYTGGGQIHLRNSENQIVGKASISVNGSASDSVGPKGELNLVNHSTRQHIKGRPLKNYTGDNVAPISDRFLTYTCADNAGSPVVDCTAHVNDTAESGGGNDSFGLVYGAYNYPYALMARGNLQWHKPNCGTTTTSKPKGPKN